MSTKPRLKLHLNGRVSIVSTGAIGWTAKDARSFIKRHYGSVGRFATRFQLPYAAACAATEPDRERVSSKSAGGVAEVRALLGLASNPSLASIRIAKAHAARRDRLLRGHA